MARILNYGNDYKSRDEIRNRQKTHVRPTGEKKGEGKAKEEAGKKEPKSKA